MVSLKPVELNRPASPNAARIGSVRQSRSVSQLAQRKRLHFQVDAHNFLFAVLLAQARALAELCETQVRCLAQFESGSNQDRIDLQA